VRRLIAEGRVDEAGALLGHHYALDGTVVQGQKRGRELGFPTANLCAENELVPPAGVYATTANIEGLAYPAITNIGTRPTFESGQEHIIETHVLDFDKDLYGARLRLGFVQRLRDEKKFDGVDALKAQIDADRTRAKDLFDRMGL
jgi:riboflavin kinase/FMN adenylyltransferase